MDVSEIRRIRLRQLLTESGLERDAFCETAGITYVQYGHYAGPKPTKNVGEIVARRVEKNLNLPLGYLDSLDHKTANLESSVVLTPLTFWEEDALVEDDEIEISYFKEVTGKDSSGLTQVLEIKDQKVKFSKRTLRHAGVDAEHAVGGTQSGDTMDDKISDGSALVIDKSKTQIKDGKIYAVEHNGLFRVRYLHKLPKGGLRLRSHNKGYKDEDYTLEQAKQQIRILGWVFWWSTVDRW